ncbi:MAG: hypothetical protein QXH07_06805 [Thermoplasmata archaeon]
MQTQDDGSIVANVFADSNKEVLNDIAKRMQNMFASIQYKIDDTILVQHTPVVDKFSIAKGDFAV